METQPWFIFISINANKNFNEILQLLSCANCFKKTIKESLIMTHV